VEAVEVVVELQVYDFDGTLVNTPVPEVGMAQYLVGRCRLPLTIPD
jgi:hypothetical protein